MSQTPTAATRPDASMTLLTEVMERPLDPGYADAAARRAAGEVAPTGWRATVRSVTVFVLAIGIGLGGVWAARDLRATPVDNARTVLIEQIRERSTTTDALVAENAMLAEEIRTLQAAAFGDRAAQVLDQADNLGIWAGTTPVVGPGVVIDMADSRSAQEGVEGTEDERVTDFDLQVVVNGLWASGAESIAINGVRLTGSTAIRTAGAAILVDLRPLTSPYTIEAIGDPQQLRTNFARTTGAAHLSALSANYSITSSIREADELSLPAGTAPNLSATADVP